MARRRPPTSTENPQVVQQAIGQKLEYLTNADVPTFYANNAQVDISNFDVKIRLGEILTVEPALIRVKNVANVYMSHDHFIAFVNALNGLVPKLTTLREQAAVYRVVDKPSAD